jgi:hypothetical protein
VEEKRKYALLIAAAILAARRLAQLDRKPSPARESAIYEAITDAEQILRKIDSMHPAQK